MKLQINTEVKTITIDQAVEAGELFELLNTMFPDFAWKEYLICPAEKIENWKDPIKIPWEPQPWFVPYQPPLTPMYPWVEPYSPTTPGTPWSFPTITCGTETSTYNILINRK